jgi:hypothetical protein
MTTIGKSDFKAQELRVHQILNSDPCAKFIVELIEIDSKFLSKTSRYEHMQAMEKMRSYFDYYCQLSTAAAVGVSEEGPEDFFDGLEQAEREDVAAKLRISPATAQRKIDIARALTSYLPLTSEALATGAISASHANAIVQETTSIIERGADPIIISEMESKAISYAEFHTPNQVGRKLKTLIANLDPNSFEELASEEREKRSVQMFSGDYGMATIVALLPAIEAQSIMNLINDCAKRAQGADILHARQATQMAPTLQSEIGKDSFLTIDAYRADAFISLMLSNDLNISNQGRKVNFGSREDNIEDESEFFSLESKELRKPSLSHRRPVTIQLTMDFATLIGLKDQPAHLNGYGPIPASIARELAMDAKWQKFITDPLTGVLLDYGRQFYVPPQALQDFIVARDRYCRFPGCAQPAHRTDIDHAIPWEEGGKTSPENLGLLCRRHHRLKTHGGWSLESYADGSCKWINQNGEEFFVPARPFSQAA